MAAVLQPCSFHWMMLPRFGNGQFAVLVLCLTLADLLTVVAGLVGGLALEVNCLLFRLSSPTPTTPRSPTTAKPPR